MQVIVHAFIVSAVVVFVFVFFFGGGGGIIYLEHYQSVKQIRSHQDLHSVGPDLDTNCLKRISAYD